MPNLQPDSLPTPARVAILETVINGDPATDTPGLRARVAALEDGALKRAKDIAEMRAILKELTSTRTLLIALITLLISNLGGIASIVQLLRGP